MAEKQDHKNVRNRKLSPEEARKVRKQVMREFPPAKNPRLQFATTGIGAQIRAAREKKGLTWYAVAKQAGIPNPGTIRDMECDRDAKISNVEAVAKVLGLSLELVAT